MAAAGDSDAGHVAKFKQEVFTKLSLLGVPHGDAAALRHLWKLVNLTARLATTPQSVLKEAEAGKLARALARELDASRVEHYVKWIAEKTETYFEKCLVLPLPEAESAKQVVDLCGDSAADGAKAVSATDLDKAAAALQFLSYCKEAEAPPKVVSSSNASSALSEKERLQAELRALRAQLQSGPDDQQGTAKPDPDQAEMSVDSSKQAASQKVNGEAATSSDDQDTGDEAWVEVKSKEGKVYYWDRRSQSCAWALPAGIRAKWCSHKATDGRTYYADRDGNAHWVMPPLGAQKSDSAPVKVTNVPLQPPSDPEVSMAGMVTPVAVKPQSQTLVPSGLAEAAMQAETPVLTAKDMRVKDLTSKLENMSSESSTLRDELAMLKKTMALMMEKQSAPTQPQAEKPMPVQEDVSIEKSKAHNPQDQEPKLIDALPKPSHQECKLQKLESKAGVDKSALRKDAKQDDKLKNKKASEPQDPTVKKKGAVKKQSKELTDLSELPKDERLGEKPDKRNEPQLEPASSSGIPKKRPLPSESQRDDSNGKSGPSTEVPQEKKSKKRNKDKDVAASKPIEDPTTTNDKPNLSAEQLVEKLVGEKTKKQRVEKENRSPSNGEAKKESSASKADSASTSKSSSDKKRAVACASQEDETKAKVDKPKSSKVAKEDYANPRSGKSESSKASSRREELAQEDEPKSGKSQSSKDTVRQEKVAKQAEETKEPSPAANEPEKRTTSPTDKPLSRKKPVTSISELLDNSDLEEDFENFSKDWASWNQAAKPKTQEGKQSDSKKDSSQRRKLEWFESGESLRGKGKKIMAPTEQLLGTRSPSEASDAQSEASVASAVTTLSRSSAEPDSTPEKPQESERTRKANRRQPRNCLRVRSRSPRREEASSPSEEIVYGCPDCQSPLEWSNHAEGAYADGWHCSNSTCCGDGRPGSYRWFCAKCQNDFCDNCEAHEAQPEAQSDDEGLSPAMKARSEAQSDDARSEARSDDEQSEAQSEPQPEAQPEDEDGVVKLHGERGLAITLRPRPQGKEKAEAAAGRGSQPVVSKESKQILERFLTGVRTLPPQEKSLPPQEKSLPPQGKEEEKEEMPLGTHRKVTRGEEEKEETPAGAHRKVALPAVSKKSKNMLEKFLTGVRHGTPPGSWTASKKPRLAEETTQPTLKEDTVKPKLEAETKKPKLEDEVKKPKLEEEQNGFDFSLHKQGVPAGSWGVTQAPKVQEETVPDFARQRRASHGGA